jgi:hypothetical protein
MLSYISGLNPSEPGQEHPRAIVTLAIGETYEKVWNTLFRESWAAYGDKFGYDVIVIASPLDLTPRSAARSPAWQKLLILSQPWSKNYDRIVWIDSDIIIAPHALDVCAALPNRAQIGICSREQMSAVEREIYWERMYNFPPTDPAALNKALDDITDRDFKDFGIERGECPEYNTGVMVFTPDLHAPLLTEVYESFDQTGLRYEQIPLSYRLQHSGKLKLLSPRFNWSIHEAMKMGVLEGFNPDVNEILRLVKNELSKCYFLHFAGSMPLMKLLVEVREKHGVGI